MNACGVAVAISQGHSWAPHSSLPEVALLASLETPRRNRTPLARVFGCNVLPGIRQKGVSEVQSDPGRIQLLPDHVLATEKRQND